jgi:hypothetical protein
VIKLIKIIKAFIYKNPGVLLKIKTNMPGAELSQNAEPLCR